MLLKIKLHGRSCCAEIMFQVLYSIFLDPWTCSWCCSPKCFTKSELFTWEMKKKSCYFLSSFTHNNMSNLLMSQSHWVTWWIPVTKWQFCQDIIDKHQLSRMCWLPVGTASWLKCLQNDFCHLIPVWFSSFEHVKKFLWLTGDTDQLPTSATFYRVSLEFQMTCPWL